MSQVDPKEIFGRSRSRLRPSPAASWPASTGRSPGDSIADSYLLASPVYHNSYSGVLKNALDYLMLRDLRYRPVALASQGGRSTQAVDHLRVTARGLLGVAIPAQVCTGEADFTAAPGGDGFYAVTDTDIQARIARQAEELLLFAKHLGALRAEMAARVG